MLIYILHFSRYFVFRLPKIPSGNYVIEDYDDNGSVRNLVNAYEEDDKWVLSSNENVRIVSNNQYVNSCELVLNNWYQLLTAEGESILLYTLPAYDSNYIVKSVLEPCKLVFGKSSQSDVFLPLSFIADSQFELSYDGVNWSIKNLNPSISLYVNTYSVIEKTLDSFDSIFIAGFKFRVCGKLLFFSNSLNIVLNAYHLQNGVSSVAVKDYNSIFQNYTDYYNSNDYFYKSPVFFKKINCLDIEIKPPEQKEERRSESMIMNLIPTVIMTFSSLITTFFSLAKGNNDFESMVTTFVMLGSMLFLSFIWPFVERFVEKIRYILKERSRKTNYRKYLAFKKDFLEKYRSEQKVALLFNNLSMDECQNVIINRTANLFSLNISQDQFLNVRIGNGKALLNCNWKCDRLDYVNKVDPLRTKMENLIEEYRYIDNAPITVSLKEPLAFINYEKNFDDLLSFILIQIAAYHDFHLLKLVILTNENSKLHSIRNLNHCWNENRTVRYVATNLQEAEFISNELVKIYTSRAGGSSAISLSPFYLILTDDINKYRNLKIIDYVVHQKEKIGFSFVTFVPRLTDVPDGCSNFCNFSKSEATVFNGDMDENDIVSFTPEFFNTSFNFSRCLSELSNIPIKSNNDASSGKTLPEKLGFLEMFNVGNVEQLNSGERWKTSQIVNSLATPIGVDTTGNILNLDLHEKKHGPHGLVAGMTGSGKSETIVTYLLSLAVNYSPDEVQFVLIDYKGGGLAGAFENRKTGIKLPHLVGTITNLDTAEMNRTLVSIKSELQRRQKVFNRAKENLNTGTIDIYKYQGLVRDGQIKEPLSHLFIVCDEFAELKQQQPDFMDEIVSAARIGRSLGIHLILATQKPSGVVDEQVWSNSKFKICCKVQTAEDSSEMLRKPDAAYIKESGRFYLQIGYDEYYIMAQSGYSGVEYNPTNRAMSKLDNNISFINSLGEVYKNATRKAEPIHNSENANNNGEELINVVKYLIGVAKKEGYQYHQLWLDNIPELLSYNTVVKKYSYTPQLFDINPVIGEYDDPARQSQGIVTLPITFGGNTFIAGNSGSGKNTLLSTIITSIITTHSIEEVNIYILDMGAEKLKKFAKAPQVGDVLTISDKKELNYFYYMIQKEMFIRQKYYSNNGGDFIHDVKNQKSPFPNMLIFLYDLDTLKDSIEYFFEDKIAPLTRNCSKYGIYFIISSNNPSNLTFSIEPNFPNIIMLNSSDYSNFFTKPPVIKTNPGRGIISINDECYEFQVPLFFSEDTEIEMLKKLIEQLNINIQKKALPVPRVPNVVNIDNVSSSLGSGLSTVPLGINYETAQPAFYNFDQLVTVMSSLRVQSFSKFSYVFQRLLLSNENTNLIILNGFSSINITPYGNAKLYSTGFSKIVLTLKNNIEKYIENPKEGKFIIMVLNYTAINTGLLTLKLKNEKGSDENNQEESTDIKEQEEVYTIVDLINLSKTINNFKFILYDTTESCEGFSTGDFVDYFDGTSGIWLGKGVDSQSLFELTSYSTSSSVMNDDGLVIISSGAKTEVKLVKE